MSFARVTAFGFALLLPAFTASAHDDSGPKADGHAPAGVMLDHMHKAGEFMLGYRYSWSGQSGDMLLNNKVASDNQILHNACQDPKVVGHEHCMMRPTGMHMQMHMLDVMYAPTNWLSLMVMPQWMSMDMKMSDVPDPAGGHAGMHMDHAHSADGFGDTVFGALVKLGEAPGHKLHAGLMFSAPTGSTSVHNPDGTLAHYMMQPGSGTWDFLPSLTYVGRADRFTWGAQLSGVVRMESANDQGYRLGNVAQATIWSSYRFADWISASVRLIHTHQGVVTGSLSHTGMGMTTADLPANYGGQFYDVGLGVNLVVPDGALKGHRLGIEWLEPVSDRPNGYQQRRDGTLVVNWSKAF